MATIYRVVTVDDEDGSELAAQYFDEAGRLIPPPATPRQAPGSGPARGAVAEAAPHPFVPAARGGGGPAPHGGGRGTAGGSGRERPAPVDDGRARPGPVPLADEDWTALFSCRAVFLPGDPARSGRMAFHAGGASGLPGRLPAEAVGELEVVVAHGRGARRRTVPAVVRPLAEALPRLLAERDGAAADGAGRGLDRTATAWRQAALYALHMAGRGLLLPGVSGEGHDAWRLGPFAPQDAAWVRALSEAMPSAAYGVPAEPCAPQGKRTGRGPVLLPDPYARLRAFLDAVADLLPRTPAAVAA
ncbi:hypothetical protein NGM37_51045, partial [Streptomyces sp. TRM76130]|nr:hypothetical protein [Streptomyces sp. TRM76130]